MVNLRLRALTGTLNWESYANRLVFGELGSYNRDDLDNRICGGD